jgi:hypothetical protein
MAYPLRNKFKGEALWPEEEQVQAALAAYTFDTDETDALDFMPTAVLYDVYLKYFGQFVKSADRPEMLNPQKFGVALRRVFALTQERQTQRRVMGKPMMGYIGVKGPGSIRSQNGPGNPDFLREHERNKLAIRAAHAAIRPVPGSADAATSTDQAAASPAKGRIGEHLPPLPDDGGDDV